MFKTFGIIILVLVLSAIGLSLYQLKTQPKTGFVLIQDLYNGFDMKKEMEKKYKTVKDARDKILDSLSFELKTIANQIAREDEKNKETIKNFEIKREEYFQKKQSFDEDNQKLTQQYDQDILTQLNQYVKDYGTENGYTYIFGNDGNGSLMHADEKHDITKPVIDFINKKYKGL